MKPITFPQANVVYAKDQPQYLPLPAYRDTSETITCWKLTFWERLTIFWRGRLWLHQLNFGNPLQPQKPRAENPWPVTGR